MKPKPKPGARKKKKSQPAFQRLTGQQLKLLYDYLPDVAFLIAVEPRDQYRFVSVNQAFLQTSGLDAKQVIGKYVPEILPPAIHQLVFKNYKKAIREGTPVSWEAAAQSATANRYSRITLQAVYNEANVCIYLVGIATDITGEKQHAEKIQRYINYLTALREVDQSITSSWDAETTLNVLITHAIRLLEVDAASILLLDPATEELWAAASSGFHSTAVATARVKVNESYAGRAILKRCVIHLPSPTESAHNLFSAGFLKADGFVSYWAVPLVAKNKALGVLEVFQRSSVERSVEWFDFFTTLAGQAAIAIDNAILLEDLESSNRQLMQAYDATIEGWSLAMDLRDKETEGHTQRVTALTLKLAQSLGVPEAELIHIKRGALLHDIGKMGVPDNILLKPSKLTKTEMAKMKKHPQFARDMLASIRYLKPAMDIPYCHHEKWDGSGYPRGLRGREIPLAARIFSVADVWDALTSNRPYRKGWTKTRARGYIQEQAGKHFDPQIVKKFLELLR
ncbi:MAG: HD domain-containing protein [Anaerolineales bacterium]|nr:HD domain-containing protein [Anaerolineales bacterium]